MTTGPQRPALPKLNFGDAATPRPADPAPSRDEEGQDDPRRPGERATRRTRPAGEDRPKRPGRRTASSTVSRTLQSVGVYVGADLRDQLRTASTQGQSQTRVTLAAIEHAHGLGGRLQETFAPASSKGGLFEPRPFADRTPSPVPVVQVTLRLTAAELATIDREAERVRAPSRSAFIAACLRLWFERS